MNPVKSTFIFPENFIWGTATSAYQIEGAVAEDGRKPSIWDVYSHTPGMMARDGENGDIACDHYHRWHEDVALLASLGIKSYRFSISWPRILPDGRGAVNQPGLDFYSRLVDALLEKDIIPFATLYHWDLPAALDQPSGSAGWLARTTAEAFLEYTDTVTRCLGDRVKLWATLNEPWCSSHLGYGSNAHAPGLNDARLSLPAAHHLLLAHGLAIPVIRANSPNSQVGIVLNLIPVYPVTDNPADREACRYYDGATNRWFLDPLYGRGYPSDMLKDYVTLGYFESNSPNFIKPGDLDAIGAPTDFLGVNYYSRSLLQAIPGKEMQAGCYQRGNISSQNKTDSGWEIYPEGLYDLLLRLNHEYHPKKMFIAENGAHYDDVFSPDGTINDTGRQEYVRKHLAITQRAIQTGVPVEGYYLWSFLDNFEWRHAYQRRFGIVYVDFETQKRTPKQSALWYRQVIVNNGLDAT